MLEIKGKLQFYFKIFEDFRILRENLPKNIENIKNSDLVGSAVGPKRGPKRGNFYEFCLIFILPALGCSFQRSSAVPRKNLASKF